MNKYWKTRTKIVIEEKRLVFKVVLKELFKHLQHRCDVKKNQFN